MCGRRGGAPLRVALSRVIVALQLYLYRHEAHVLLACVRRGRINKRLGILAGGGWGMLAKHAHTTSHGHKVGTFVTSARARLCPQPAARGSAGASGW